MFVSVDADDIKKANIYHYSGNVYVINSNYQGVAKHDGRGTNDWID